MRHPRAFNPPDRIFLQVGEIERDCEFRECYDSGEVTWEHEAIYDTDIEYSASAAQSTQADGDRP